MAQSRALATTSRWQEWTIVIAIVALAAIGVASIWGGSIRRWIDSSDAQQPAGSSPARPSGAEPRL